MLHCSKTYYGQSLLTDVEQFPDNYSTIPIFFACKFAHLYTHDVIGIKMMYRDLPYYEGISPKHAVNIKQAQKSRKLFTYL